MHRKFLIVLFASASLALAQMGRGSDPGFPAQQPNPGTPNINNPTQQLEQYQVDDRAFARAAAMDSLAGAQLGKLAVENGSSDAVKQFGQKLADGQSEVDKQLKAVAGQESVKIPDTLDSRSESRVEKLSKLSGPAFDKQFVKDQIKDRQRDVESFQQEAQYGNDAALKQFANKILPELQQNLDSAKNLKKEVEGRD
jgi:putative membrane protein